MSIDRLLDHRDRVQATNPQLIEQPRWRSWGIVNEQTLEDNEPRDSDIVDIHDGDTTVIMGVPRAQAERICEAREIYLRIAIIEVRNINVLVSACHEAHVYRSGDSFYCTQCNEGQSLKFNEMHRYREDVPVQPVAGVPPSHRTDPMSSGGFKR